MQCNHLKSLENKKILLGISGGIAAYKCAALVRLFKQSGIDLEIVMTESAAQFITPTTLQTLNQKPVYSDVFDRQFEEQIGHIQLARWPDLILIAPASANCIARIANGFANDLLSTLCLATRAPIAIAPAMNQAMWTAEVTQMQVNKIKALPRHYIIPPESGVQACGEYGEGRLASPNSLLQWIKKFFNYSATQCALSSDQAMLDLSSVTLEQDIMCNQPLLGKHVLLTAGPTREAIDPVRYLTNRSSGKMGYAMAIAARTLGAQVTLISGPTHLASPDDILTIKVTSTQEMYNSVLNHLPCDIFIGVAAVCDYKPVKKYHQKIKKNDQHPPEFSFEKTIDILHHIAQLKNKPYTVGFAAETENLMTQAKKKLKQKGVDIIAANWVDDKTLGFDADNNSLYLLAMSGNTLHLPMMPKQTLAHKVMKFIVENYH